MLVQLTLVDKAQSATLLNKDVQRNRFASGSENRKDRKVLQFIYSSALMFGRKRHNQAPPFGEIGTMDDRDIGIDHLDLTARRQFWTESRLLLRDLAFALMIAALVVVFIVQPVKVEGTSMLPRLHDGERIFVNKMIYYGLPPLERGDIVVFWYPEDPSKSYIKRIVGLPGETVQIREGHVLINGRELEENYLDAQLNHQRVNQQPVFVKDHYYFVMGDNRDNSSDSRYWGLVPEKYIYGKALLRYWPLGQAGVISHEANFRLVPGHSVYDSNAIGGTSGAANGER